VPQECGAHGQAKEQFEVVGECGAGEAKKKANGQGWSNERGCREAKEVETCQ
jgi:hypothetical protein